MDDIWATKSEDVGLIDHAISFQNFQPMWSWSTNVTDRRTDDMRSQDRALRYSASKVKKYTRLSWHVLFFSRDLFSVVRNRMWAGDTTSIMPNWVATRYHNAGSITTRWWATVADVCITYHVEEPRLIKLITRDFFFPPSYRVSVGQSHKSLLAQNWQV